MDLVKKIFYYSLLLLVVGCKEKIDNNISLSLNNEERLKISNIEINISNKIYKIDRIEEKKVLNIPIYSDSHIDLKFCLDDKLIKVTNIGYYTIGLVKTYNTEIYFYKNSMIVNTLNLSIKGYEYSYKIIGKC